MIIFNFISIIILFFLIKFYLNSNFLKIIDSPNYRSMHAISKPTMGGFFLIIFILVNMFLENIDNFYINFLLLIFAFTIGFLDDLKKIRFIAKLGLLIILSIFFVNYKFENIDLFFTVFIFIFVFHFINIFNFMDGTDGFALSQTLFFFISTIILNNDFYLNDHNLIYYILVTSVLLYFNFPNAKMFIGNIGSYALSILILILFCDLKFELNTFINFIIIFLLFYIDTSYTLLKRIFERKNIFKAHRDHLYQRVATRNNHLFVLLIFSAYNFLIILPSLLIINQIFDNNLYIKIIFILINIILYFYIRKYVYESKKT